MTPLQLITALRKSDDYIQDIYTYGGCYKFHIFLKTFFPDAKPFINLKGTHIATQWKGNLYDIRGKIAWHNVKEYRPVQQKDLKMIRKWSFSKNNMLQITECPACEEPLTYNGRCMQIGS